MLYLKAQARRWVADEPQPGLVEVRALDACGREWTFIDKQAIFSTEPLSPDTRFPVDVLIACTEVGRTLANDGQQIVTITTAAPWGVATLEGIHEFEMSLDQLITQ